MNVLAISRRLPENLRILFERGLEVHTYIRRLIEAGHDEMVIIRRIMSRYGLSEEMATEIYRDEMSLEEPACNDKMEV